MDGKIYSFTYATAHELRWEWGCQVIATKEVNGYAIWDNGPDGVKLIEFMYGVGNHDRAIERAVDLGREKRAAFLKDPEPITSALEL